jgi:hypothetical protein
MHRISTYIYVWTYSCVIRRSNNSVSCKLDEFVSTECVTLQPKVKMEKLSVLVYSYVRNIEHRVSIKEFWWFYLSFSDIYRDNVIKQSTPAPSRIVCKFTIYSTTPSPHPNGATAPSGPRPFHYRSFAITLTRWDSSVGMISATQWPLPDNIHRDRYLCLWRDSNPQPYHASGRRPTP